jgi:predicted ribonuclease YlaK
VLISASRALISMVSCRHRSVIAAARRVPLRVVDELDKQKYGRGFLAESATKALRFLQQTLAGRGGESVSIRPGRAATLEVWTQTEDRGPDADGARHPAPGAGPVTQEHRHADPSPAGR